jgi:hypothetical protein
MVNAFNSIHIQGTLQTPRSISASSLKLSIKVSASNSTGISTSCSLSHRPFTNSLPLLDKYKYIAHIVCTTLCAGNGDTKHETHQL